MINLKLSLDSFFMAALCLDSKSGGEFIHKLVERFYPEFERMYEEHYQDRYGFWRPIIGTPVERFLECGDLKQGFARVRCAKCRHEVCVAFSCRGRCICPSCLPAESLGAGREGGARPKPSSNPGTSWLNEGECFPS